MTIVITDVGLGSGATGATMPVGYGAIPPGAVIFSFLQENSSGATSGTLSDNVNGSHTKIGSGFCNGIGGQGGGSLFFVVNSSASTTTVSGTYTRGISGTTVMGSFFYATGVGGIDSSVTVSTVGTSTTPSVTSGTPSQAGDLMIAAMCCNATSPTYTQDSTHSWVSPFDKSDSTNGAPAGISVGGGDQVNSGSSAITYAPSWSSTGNGWFLIIAGFKAAASGGGGSGVSVIQQPEWIEPPGFF